MCFLTSFLCIFILFLPFCFCASPVPFFSSYSLSSPLPTDPSPSLPSPRYGHSLVPYSDGFLILYGYKFVSRPVWFSDVWYFNAKNSQWNCVIGCEQQEQAPASASAPVARYGHSAACDSDNFVYLYGGDDGGNSLGTSSYHYNLFNDFWRLDLKTRRWEQIQLNSADPVPALSQQCSASFNDQIYLFGGLTKPTRANDESSVEQSAALYTINLQSSLIMELKTPETTQLPCKKTIHNHCFFFLCFVFSAFP
jgi:N-acetylneuraminic acid mutarotase